MLTYPVWLGGLVLGQVIMVMSLWLLGTSLRRGPSGWKVKARDELTREAMCLRIWAELAGKATELGFWRLHRKGKKIVEWSEGMFRLYGVSPAEFSPDLDSVLNAFHEDNRKDIAAGLAVITAEGGSRVMRARLRRADGVWRHIQLYVQSHDDFVLGVMLDETVLKLAEEQMRNANDAVLRANAALKEMSQEDQLTGLNNRRQFDTSLVAEFKRALRSDTPLGLVLVDMDHFRSYNEQYGKAAGDAVLRRVAQVVKSVPRRAGDVVARYSGEQIAILLPLADHAGALRVAEIILDKVRALRIQHPGGEGARLTVSCGATSFTGLQDLSNPLDLVRQADQAVYRAKMDGRDRALGYRPGMDVELSTPYGPALAEDMEQFIKNRME